MWQLVTHSSPFPCFFTGKKCYFGVSQWDNEFLSVSLTTAYIEIQQEM